MNIGKLEQVTNLRSIWPYETEFSDWLVSTQGLQIIERDLNVALENAQREVRGSNYPCDIVGNVAGEKNHVVIIENQYDCTNHDHLGKLLTYGAVNSATTAIWIAEKFSEDHRSAIDWLNSNTPPQINFFLALIRVFRIGESPLAPKLEIICQPNIKAKVKRTLEASEINQAQESYRQLWTQIHAYLVEKKVPFGLRKPATGHWSTIRLGVNYEVNLLALKNTVGVEFVATPTEREAVYEHFLRRKTEIEAAIGTPLSWECKPDIKRFRIFLFKDLNPWHVETQVESFDWLNHFGCAFVRVFKAEVTLFKTSVSSSFAIENEVEVLE